MADDQVPGLVLSSRFGGIGALFKRVVARTVRFLITYQAHVNEWLRARIVRSEQRTDRLEAELAELRVLVGQLVVALPQSLTRLQSAIDRCERQIESSDDHGVATELGHVRRALARLESRHESGGPPAAERVEIAPARATDAPAARPHANGEAGRTPLFADAFRRARQPLRPIGDPARNVSAGETNGARREP
jgi:hypothetical protein